MLLETRFLVPVKNNAIAATFSFLDITIFRSNLVNIKVLAKTRNAIA
ncbi:hypothetical protein [Oscillatoria sp. HE19RPO]|nr:hypothetical protein [Oscillatoria sp. HE19RPO]